MNPFEIKCPIGLFCEKCTNLFIILNLQGNPKLLKRRSLDHLVTTTSTRMSRRHSVVVAPLSLEQEKLAVDRQQVIVLRP
jgi:hypothetical protein